MLTCLPHGFLKMTTPSVSLNVYLFGFPINLCLQFPVYGTALEKVLSYKYLGVTTGFHQISLGVAMSLVFV